MESGKTFGAYELKVDRTFDETNDSMWISKRIWTIEETLLRIDGNLVFLHFIRRRSDWIVKNTHEKTARLQIGLRRNVTTTSTRHQHDTSRHDGKRPVGGSRRQSSNDSSTIKTDRQIFMRKDSASADKELHSGLAGISSSNLHEKQRQDTSRTRRKSPLEELKGQIKLLDGQRTKTALSALKNPPTIVTIFTNVWTIMAVLNIERRKTNERIHWSEESTNDRSAW